MTDKTQRNENILRRQVFPIPANVSPVGTRCLMVNIPDDDEHEAIFMGAIDLLCKWNSWQRDGTNNAVQASEAWKRAIYDHPMFRACGDEITTIIDEMEYEMAICEQLRFHNGKLQGLCCGEWTDIPGQGDTSVGGPSQPGDGATQPGPGETECYSGRLLGTGKWYLPTSVNTGDTIEITDPSGAWHDGAFSVWRCPDGNIFFAGACIPSTATDGGDPLPSQPHMSLIAQIGSTFYPVLTGGIFTVPGGVTDSPVTFQANDSVLTDNAGEIAFKACVKNNQAGTFHHEQNFAVNPGIFGLCGTSDNGVFTPGTGFVATTWGPDGFGHYHKEVCVNATIPARTLTKIAFKGNLTKGSTIAPSVVCIGINDQGGALLLIDHATAVDGTNITWQWTGSASLAVVGIFIETGVDNSDPGGSALVSSVIVEGLGSDPF